MGQNTLKLNNTIANNPWVHKEFEKEIRMHNEKENNKSWRIILKSCLEIRALKAYVRKEQRHLGGAVG